LPLDRSPPGRRTTGRITLSDVARAAGVSTSTASRALRGERAVAPDLIAQVQAAAQRLAYVPDPAARALASRRSDHVAVLLPLLSNTLFVDLLEAAQKALRSQGYQTLMGVTHYDRQEEEQLLRELLLHRPAGVLITGRDHSPASLELIAGSGVPCVHLMDLADASGPQLSYSVGFDQAQAGAELTGHLLRKGYRRVAFAAAQLDARVMQRMSGWRRALQAAGLYDPTLEWLNPAASSLALGGQMFEQIVQQRPAVDAIFFCNDDLAHGALLCALRRGIRVPEQVAIVGFNDLTGSDQTLPPLTTVRTPRARIGEAAAQMLLGLIKGQAPEQARLDLGFELIERGSA
jgi:LacI family transcriptional regulator, gluconate utilization system Gnt-I transcriptional repressor